MQVDQVRAVITRQELIISRLPDDLRSMVLQRVAFVTPPSQSSDDRNLTINSCCGVIGCRNTVPWHLKLQLFWVVCWQCKLGTYFCPDHMAEITAGAFTPERRCFCVPHPPPAPDAIRMELVPARQQQCAVCGKWQGAGKTQKCFAKSDGTGCGTSLFLCMEHADARIERTCFCDDPCNWSPASPEYD
jgi:hypothetical protein